jgi:hypothetical protein
MQELLVKLTSYIVWNWLVFTLVSVSVSAQTGKQYLKSYKPVSEKYIDSILKPNKKYERGRAHDISHYRIVEENVAHAKTSKVSFNASCCADLGLYAGRVNLLDTMGKVAFSLTNKNIAGIDPKTGIGNDVSGIYLTINGNIYELPIVSYNKGKTFDSLIKSKKKAPSEVIVYAHLISKFRSRNVIPVLLVDDIVSK